MLHLPTLDQLTAVTTEDPVETISLNPIDPEGYYYSPLEFALGFERRGQMDLDTPYNKIQLRSSMIKLLRTNAWALLPTMKVMEEVKKYHRANLECPMNERKFYTDVFPVREYEYVLHPIEIDVELAIISRNGERQTFQHPYTDLPHFRSNAHPLHVIMNASRKRAAAALSDNFLPRILTEIRMLWNKTPHEFLYGNDLEDVHGQSGARSRRDTTNVQPEVTTTSSLARMSNCSPSWRPSLVLGRFPSTEDWVMHQARFQRPTKSTTASQTTGRCSCRVTQTRGRNVRHSPYRKSGLLLG
ncbi:hypothetical protein L218DRAFT_958764 [Marasmius fiardii PR-910]|nr:hypothetical protein L218DRAFT_958764 [Marasmius fiardii PR-910]